MAGNIWDAVLGRIETKVNRHSYLSWFQHTSLLRDDGGSIAVRVPDPMAVEWISRHYTGVIEEALLEVGRKDTRFKLVPESDRTLDALPPSAPIPAPAVASVDSTDAAGSRC